MSEAKREGLSSNLVKHVKFHFGNLRNTDLKDYTVERTNSAYPKAKSDIVIFNPDGVAIMKGREFGGGQTSLWTS